MAYILGSMSEEDPQGAAEPAVNLRDNAVAPARQTIAEILERLPAAPGVYIMKDRRGKAVYIGKAGVLRNRVRQYFQASSGDNRDFVPLLEGIVADIETVITSNEKEALLLENTLIKKHQPRFNVNLRDDKNYLVLRLDPEGEWPRLEVVRKIAGDGAFYFGPYHSAIGVPRGAARRQPPLPAAHLHRSRAAQPAAALPAVPDQALPRAVRAAGVARRVRRPGARRAAVPRGQERRALAAAGHAHEGGGGAHRLRARGRGARPAARARDHARGAARGVDRLRRPGRVRLLPPGDRARDRRDVDPPGQDAGQPRLLVHRAGVPRRRAAVVVRRPLLRPERRAARRGAAAVRDRRRRAQGRVAGGEAHRAAAQGRDLRPAARRPAQAGRAGAEERGGELRVAAQRARGHRGRARQAAAAAEAAAPAAGHRVLRHLAHPGLRDGGVDGGVRRRAAREVALPHVQGPHRRSPRRLRVDVRGAVAPVPARARAAGGQGRRRVDTTAPTGAETVEDESTRATRAPGRCPT